MELEPGLPVRWGNITTTLLIVSAYELPFAHTQFITDGRQAAVCSTNAEQPSRLRVVNAKWIGRSICNCHRNTGWLDVECSCFNQHWETYLSRPTVSLPHLTSTF